MVSELKARKGQKALAIDVAATVKAWHADGFMPRETLGRSIIFLAPNSSERRVLKVQKDGEDEEALHEEANNLQVLRGFVARDELALQSKLPNPSGVGHVKRASIATWLPKGIDLAAYHALVGKKPKNKAVYAYRCEASYLQYVNDPTLRGGTHPKWRRSLDDLFELLKHGVALTELTPLFHNTESNRADGGRYRALNCVFAISGGGRLHAWRDATNFPNLRGPHGDIADITALALLPEVAKAGSAFRRQFFADVGPDEQAFSRALRASFQAELLLTWELMLGRQAGESNAWKGLDDELQAMYSHAVALCCRARGCNAITESNLVAAMQEAVDWTRYAAQMRIFMTPEHVHYVQAKKFPAGVFAEQPTFGDNRDSSFDPERGYVGTDGKSPSLGPVNGPYPIKEGEKARAIVAIIDQIINLLPQASAAATAPEMRAT